MSDASTELRRCASGGLAVGTDDWLPGTPFDRDFGALFPPVGCNRLACRRCGARVASFAGLVAASGVEAAALLAAEDPRAIPGVEPQPHFRLYACRCVHLQAASPADFLPRDSDMSLQDLLSPAPDWACAGHPALPWPCEVDGVRLDDATDLGALVGEVLSGRLPASVPWTTRRTERPAFWLARVSAALAPPVAAARITRLAAQHLESEDAHVLRSAWALFEHLPDAAGAERLAGAFLRGRDRLAAVLDPLIGKTPMIRLAADALLRRLSVRGSDGRPADGEAVRALLSAPPGSVPDAYRSEAARWINPGTCG